MTPSERPTGWILLDKRRALPTRHLYWSLFLAEAGRDVHGHQYRPEPVWTRDDWATALRVAVERVREDAALESADALAAANEVLAALTSIMAGSPATRSEE